MSADKDALLFAIAASLQRIADTLEKMVADARLQGDQPAAPPTVIGRLTDVALRALHKRLERDHELVSKTDWMTEAQEEVVKEMRRRGFLE